MYIAFSGYKPCNLNEVYPHLYRLVIEYCEIIKVNQSLSITYSTVYPLRGLSTYTKGVTPIFLGLNISISDILGLNLLKLWSL